MSAAKASRLPRVTAGEVIRVLERLDFTLSRSSGSHRIYKNKANRRVTVPYHAGKTLHPKVLTNILDDAGLSVDDFIAML
ncbi:MAG: type II toxin-antitoxin system HicA family toxin [Chloroflexi bacterium]|nr:type II toxin-antitoxin system HicA family toxin [Chloroflexota bacterium]